jgi:colanic acid biosynthesis glycosyl transferase WcaI
VVFVGDTAGEVARLVVAHDCGIAVPSGDVDAFVQAILSLREEPLRRAEYGARARRAFEENWDRPVALGRWRAVLRAVGTQSYTGSQDVNVSI